MKSAPRSPTAAGDQPRRGSVLIVSLLMASIIAISLVSYIQLSTNSLKLSHRTFFANAANNLVEAGLEEAVYSFNQMGSGTAVATVWSTTNGWTTDTTKVAGVTVTNGGSGYTVAPTVTFSGGGGSGAAATANLSGGVITGVRISNGGSGYTSAPTIAFSGGDGSGVTATATNTAAKRTLSTFTLDQNAQGVVKVYVAGYDGVYSTPIVVAQATITPFDGGAPIIKIIAIQLRFNGPFANGVVAKNGLTWNGQPMADSWISNASGAAAGPWAAYPGAGARANTTVADLTGNVRLGAQGAVNGTLALGAGAVRDSSGSVTGAVTHNFNSTFALPTYPTTASVPAYTNLAVVPAILPSVSGLDPPTVFGGDTYYYFVMGNVGTTSITANKKVIIVGSNTSFTGTVTLPSTSTLTVYTDGTINGTWVNNAWAGALQIYTSTSLGTTISGNQNIKACIYAPNSAITGNGGGNSGAFYGSFIGATVTSNGHMDFHYDESLKSIGGSKPWTLSLWRELQSASERATFATQLASF